MITLASERQSRPKTSSTTHCISIMWMATTRWYCFRRLQTMTEPTSPNRLLVLTQDHKINTKITKVKVNRKVLRQGGLQCRRTLSRDRSWTAASTKETLQLKSLMSKWCGMNSRGTLATPIVNSVNRITMIFLETADHPTSQRGTRTDWSSYRTRQKFCCRGTTYSDANSTLKS